MYKSFISIKFIPNNLIDFVTIVNVIIVYFIFDILLLVYKKVTDFFIFFLISCNFTEFIGQF